METTTRPVLSFDGRGINGPDAYRSRIATFTNQENAAQWGTLLASAPALLASVECEEAAFQGIGAYGENAATLARHGWDGKEPVSNFLRALRTAALQFARGA